MRLAANGTRAPWRTHPAPSPLTRARRTPQLARVLQGREHHRVEAAGDRPRRRHQEGGALGRHGAWDVLRLLGRPDRQAPTTRRQARLGRGRSALRSHCDQGAAAGPLCATPRHRALTSAEPPHARQVVEHAGLGDSVKIEIGDLAEKFDRIAAKYSLGPPACWEAPSWWWCHSSLPWRLLELVLAAAGCVGLLVRASGRPGPDGGQAAVRPHVGLRG